MTHALRVVIRRFDGWLSRVEGVESFSDDPQVFMRLQLTRAAHAIDIPEAQIPEGAKVLMIHLDNERVPIIPRGGADLAYAMRFHRQAVRSWRALAARIEADPALADVLALGAVSGLFLMGADGGAAMMRGYGFTRVPYRRRGGRFGEFWENFYSWWLIWAYNPESTGRRSILDMQHTEFWITRQHFLEKYGS